MSDANTELATTTSDVAYVMEQVLMAGDLGKMSSQDRVLYYNTVCSSVGLNPLTRPFDYIQLNGKLTLYAKKDCTDQLRNIHEISVSFSSREVVEGVFVVTANARKPNGRTDESIGAVTIEGLKGESRANAMMKAETKAKRRVTLSICGLGLLDETEIDSIPPSSRPPRDDDAEFHAAWDSASKEHQLSTEQGREVLKQTLSKMRLEFGATNESTRTKLIERYRKAKPESIREWKFIGVAGASNVQTSKDADPDFTNKTEFEEAAANAGAAHDIDGEVVFAGLDKIYNGRPFEKVLPEELRIVLTAIRENRFDYERGQVKSGGNKAA